MTVVAFTGTQKGLSDGQLVALDAVLRGAVRAGSDRILNGLDVGADQEAAALARKLGMKVIGFPASELGHPRRSTFRADVEFAVRPPLARNRRMASACDRLVACPRQTREFLLARAAARGVPVERVVVRGSGTWAAVRYALAARKPVLLVFPDGTTATLEELREARAHGADACPSGNES